MSQVGLFDIENRLRSLSALKDPLETLQAHIPWEIFRPKLVKILRKKTTTGRPPFDSVLMFKILVIQSLYGLSDHQVEFQVKDRLSFMRFLGLGPESRIPDEKTVWLYRETLSKGGHISELFELFNGFLNKAGFQAQKGMIVDATLVQVPRQRNTVEENEAIKNGIHPRSITKKEAVRRQKDMDARWTRKRDENYFGYKNHVCVDVEHKLIRNYTVTSASVHDINELEKVLDPWNRKQEIFADSAYCSKGLEASLGKLGYKPRFCEKGYRNRELTDEQKASNREKSKIRARVEHVFGWMYQKTKGALMRGVGQARIEAKIGLRNLVYNFSRFSYIARPV